MIKDFRKKTKKYFYKMIFEERSEHSIALGFAIGTFISILPSPGINLLVGLLIVLLFKRINKVSLFGALFFWNSIVLIPVYIASYHIGNMIFSSASVVRYNIVVADIIYNFSRRFLIGNVILAILISILSYLALWGSLKKYKKRILRLLKRKK